MAMNVFVLGGTGFIGRHVVRRLHQAGHQVVVFHRGHTRDDFAGVHTILGDRDNLRAIGDEVERLAPDVVIDVVPYTEQHALDVVATFRGRTRRVVALSSADVYRNYDGLRGVGSAPPDACPLAENSPLRETLFPYRARARDPTDSMYFYEKILVERVFLGASDPPGTVLRLPMVYGPGDRQHRLFPYIKRMQDGRSNILLAQGQDAWHWTRGYVENVAAAVALAATDSRAAGRVYNVGEVRAATEGEWVETIGRVARWNGAIVPLPVELLPPGVAPNFDWRYHLATDTQLLRQQLGFVEPIDADEALRRSIEWESVHPPTTVRQRGFDYAAEDAAIVKALGR